MSGDFNPYENQGKESQGGYNQNNYRQNNNGGKSYGNGYNKQGNGYNGYKKNYGGGGDNYAGGGGNNFQNKTQQKGRQYTPEDLKNASLPLTAVFTGEEHVPDHIAQTCIRLARAFEAKGFKVRSGGLRGFDEIVERAVFGAELHLPFKNFNKKQGESYYTNEMCMELARRFKPDIDQLPDPVKSFYAKNPRMIYGRYLNTPAQIVIIWTEDGCEHPNEITQKSGSTGHVLKMAYHSGINIINLQRPDAEQRIKSYLERIYVKEQTAAVPSQDFGAGQHSQSGPTNEPSYGSGPSSGYGGNPSTSGPANQSGGHSGQSGYSGGYSNGPSSGYGGDQGGGSEGNYGGSNSY